MMKISDSNYELLLNAIDILDSIQYRNSDTIEMRGDTMETSAINQYTEGAMRNLYNLLDYLERK